MNAKKPRDQHSCSVRFQIPFAGEPDKPIDAALYAFDGAGRLLDAGRLEKGTASLDLHERQLRRARLFVAPVVPDEQPDRITVASMARRNAYEPMWRYESGQDVYELLPVPEIMWPLWYWCSCRVRGRVIKVETLGGVTYEKPVCQARVHVCEVDRLPWIIRQLPDPLVLRLRDELLEAVRRPIPRPAPPGPGPMIDRGDIDPLPPLARARHVFGGRDAMQADVQAPELEDQSVPMHARMLDEASPAIRAGLRSRSVTMVREALLANLELIRIYWCHWDWLWPLFRYTCQEVAVVETDSQGRFDTTIWYPCGGDHPDLFFWVEYSIGGSWQTVYRPSLRCHTHWNYACGSEVTIRLTDPRVPGCGDHPELLGKKVVVKTVGRQVSMGEIHGDSPVPAEKAKEGQVLVGWINAGKASPFGGTLEPRVDFGNGLAAAGITHYRWSQRPLGSTDENDWQVLDLPVSRHYRETSAPGDPVVYKSLQIGPDTTITGYYTLIDPTLPPQGEEWEVLDERFDLASAYLDSTLLAPGKYELKLELFRDVSGTMTRVDLTSEGVELHEIIDPAPLVEGSYTTAPAAADRAVIDSGTGHVVGYRLVLHVDNRVCYGTIDEVTVAGVPAGPCGFLEYSNELVKAQISFRASHPADFASFDFDVVRVATPLVEASANGLVDEAAVNGFVRGGDLFSKDLSVATLMSSGLAPGETPCTRAAFAEALHVYALATNGYGRLSHLDAPRGDDPLQIGLRAFAIAPA